MAPRVGGWMDGWVQGWTFVHEMVFKYPVRLVCAGFGIPLILRSVRDIPTTIIVLSALL